MPDEAPRALRVHEGRVRSGQPTLARKSVEENESRHTALIEPARHLVAFLVDHDPAIAPTGHDKDGRTVRLLRTKNRHTRAPDAEDVPIIVSRIDAPLF